MAYSKIVILISACILFLGSTFHAYAQNAPDPEGVPIVDVLETFADIQEPQGVENENTNIETDSVTVEENAQEGSLAVGAPVPDYNVDEIVPTEMIVMRLVEDEVREYYKEDIVEAPDFPSLMFLPENHALLRAAISRFPRKKTAEEMADEGPQLPDEQTDSPSATGVDGIDVEVIEYERNVSLGGILFYNESNWIIWLNEKRVTPKALPEEITDISVEKGAVKLKWLDKKTNTVYPIRLKPNQTFNLDARVFLPG